MAYDYLRELAGISLLVGLIGIDEYRDRIAIIDWLEDASDAMPDPRNGEVTSGRERGTKSGEDLPPDEKKMGPSQDPDSTDPDLLSFCFQKRWLFTMADPDTYPSAPHGHDGSPNREWPKLNPYSGRVFVDMHMEDRSEKLSKSQMRSLWRDQKFRDFCYRHVYMHWKELNHKFPWVANPLIFPIW